MAKTKKKKVSGKKKRKLSPKQKAALKKGQAALAKWRRENRKPDTKKKKKSTKSKPKKVSTKKTGGTKVATAKSVVKKTTRKLSGLARRSGAVEMLQDAGIVIVSGVTAGFVVSKLPIKDPRIKSLIPIGAGIVLAGITGRKNKLLMRVSQGMVVLGSVSLFKLLAPGVPMLAGERVILLPQNQNRNGMGRRIVAGGSGRSATYMGRRVVFNGYGNRQYMTSAS